ncbi:Signal transduction histidine kinase [Saccharicrinis carchari]|uniref:histidine kinase n=1 Tax=Saccharicrinis carchari TaxID=1168039 RepID=A0A521ER48_SACCC|nr:HAMP domain-containing sensor histidine kinase [Saccharicrinis carchari]SMO86414.1 Signal transduction histidine kinase [Saccharicrinis carchari]
MNCSRKRREITRKYTRWLFENNKQYIRNLLLMYMSLYPIFAVLHSYGTSKPFSTLASLSFFAGLPLLIAAYVCTFIDKCVPYIRTINATAFLGVSLNITLTYAYHILGYDTLDSYYTILVISLAMLGLSMSKVLLINLYIALSAILFILISVFVHELPTYNSHLFVRSSTYVIVASGLFTMAGLVIDRFLFKLFCAQKNITKEIVKISDQKDTLENLNETKDRFFSIISHDLRSPFTSLIGYFDILLRNDGKEFKVRKDDIEKIYLHVRRTYNLLNNLLNWSKTQLNEYEHKPKRYKLGPIFAENRSLYREIASQKGIKITHSYPRNAMVYCNKEMIATIIRNLIFNAIKFTRSRGEIHLSARQIGENEIEIAVKDNGIGMHDKDIDKVLNPTIHHVKKGTHSEKGAGIGLIICNDILKKHNSKMQIESKRNVGSKFFFVLPIYPEMRVTHVADSV